MAENRLATVRNAVGMSQKELGQRVSQAIDGKSISDKYAQKKVSLWEGSHASPNEKEIVEIARLLAQPEEVVRSWFRKLPSSALELYTELSTYEYPSLVAACYSGKPKAGFDQDVFQALVAAVSSKTSFAMFFPFPTNPPFDMDSSPISDLYDAYRAVWQGVRARHEEILLSLSAEARGLGQHALYSIAEEKPNILVPPSKTRYTLVIKQHPNGSYEKTLHIWVESESVEGLFRVGSFSDEPAQPQLIAWQAYFSPIIERWLNDGRLPESCGTWRSHTVNTVPLRP